MQNYIKERLQNGINMVLQQVNCNDHNEKIEAWKEILEGLKDSLLKILIKNSSQLSFEQLYRMTFDIVREKKCHLLYEIINDLILNHLKGIKADIQNELIENNLTFLIKQWDDHFLSTNMFRDVLMFFEETYIIKQKLETVFDLSMNIFRDEVIRHNEIKENLQNILLGMIVAERNGSSIDNVAFKSIINMLFTLSKNEGNKIEYEQIFENPFLLQSAIFYKQEAQRLLSDDVDAITYINNYETRCNEEKERIKRLLHEKSENAVLNILEKCLIKDHLYKIIELKNGFNYMLETACRKELKMIYEWFKNIDKENEIVDMIMNSYREYGLSIVEQENILDKDHCRIIHDVVQLKERYTEYVKSCFQNNDDLRRMIDEIFIMIFNQNPRMSEFLSSYIHETLRKKDLSDEILDEKIKVFMEFFCLLNDKDIFERFYKNHLTKRLLLKPNLEAEKKLLMKFKTECGVSFTSLLETMLNDMEISSTHMDLFNAESIRNDQCFGGIDFSVTVLQSGAWRILDFAPCNIPAAPISLFELYKTFYNDKHNGRKLTLQANLGSATVKANFNQSKKNKNLKERSVNLDVSTLQMTILMLFNEHESLSINEIHQITGIPEKNLITSLNPLVIGKPIYRVLKRIGKFQPNKPLEMDNKIVINEEFYSKTQRVKIPFNVTHWNDRDEREVIEERTNRERGYEIDAAVVRIMKDRKQLTHSELVSEVITMLKNRFKPNVKFIDVRIANCVEREYLEKKKDDSNTYIYIA